MPVRGICYLVFFVALVLISARSQETARPQETTSESTVRGAVYDAQGKPAAGATVHLQPSNGGQLLTTSTDEHGLYTFAALPAGVYSLRAEMNGFADAQVASIFLGPKETKQIDLTLGSAVATAHTSSAPEFFDQPKFTVSGVTDTTSLGGHGSDTAVRTRETLAKETAALGKTSTGAPLSFSGATSVASEAALRAKVERQPQDFDANRDLGEFLISVGRARDAIPYLEHAAALKPDDYKNAYDLALANAEGGNYERARENAQALLIHTDKAELDHLLADVQEKLGNSLEAVHEYQRAAALDPSESYFFDWGSELLLHHAPEPALDVFTQGNRLFPDSLRMLIGIGAAWFVRGSYDQALQKIRQASELNPQDPAPYLFMGKIESAQASASEVLVEKLRQFVAMQPESAEANYYYAVALWKQQKSPSSAEASAQIESFLNKAVRLDPNFAAAYLQLGIVHSDERDFPRAISDYQHAIEAGQKQSDGSADAPIEEAHYRLSQLYRQTGEADKAKAELQLYDRAAKESAQQADRERHEVRQFVYTLRDQIQAQQ